VKAYIIGSVILLAVLWSLLVFSSSAPLQSFTGPLAAVTSAEDEAADRLSTTVEGLAQDIGPRGQHTPGSEEQTTRFIQGELRRMRLDGTEVALDCAGVPGTAIEVVVPGRAIARESIILAAHVDSAAGSPGADDNASGVAVLLEVLRTLSGSPCDRTLRFVFWSPGAAPSAGTEKSAAAAYAARLHGRREKVALVLCLDSLGNYSDVEGSQSVPFPFNFFFPKKGNFVAFVGDWSSHGAMDRALEQFRQNCKFPSEAFSLPSGLDFASQADDGFLRDAGFAALRVTDTGSWRNASVGTSGDRTTSLDYRRMARVSKGLSDMVVGLGKRTTSLL